jgi:hypothetical protein
VKAGNDLIGKGFFTGGHVIDGTMFVVYNALIVSGGYITSVSVEQNRKKTI